MDSAGNFIFIIMKIIKILSAPATMYILLFLYIMAMAMATFAENTEGTAYVREYFYYSWWFILLQLLLAGNLIAILVYRKWFRQRNWGSLMFHIAFLIILAGAAVTHFSGTEGLMHIREGEKVDYMMVGPKMEKEGLPFAVELTDFRLKRYPGSHSPSSYESDLIIHQDGKQEKVYIRMNKVVDVDGYRLFQSSYDRDEQGTVLTVSYDFPGMQLTYLGYILMILGFIVVCFNRNSRFQLLRQEMKKIRMNGKAMLCLGLLCLGTMGAEAVPEIDRGHADKFGQLVVQNPKGRLEPVNTWTSQLLRKLYQDKDYQGMDGDQFFLSLMAFPDEWSKVPFIKVKNRELLKKLGREGQEYIAWADIFDSQGRYTLAGEVEEVYAKSPAGRNGYDNDLLKLDECVNIVYQIFQGQLLAVFPHEQDAEGKWYSSGDDLSVFQGQDSLFVSKIMIWYADELYNSVRSGNWQEADRVLGMIQTYQQAKNKVLTVDQKRIEAEIFYNKADIFTWCRKFYLICGGILLLLVFITMVKEIPSLKRISGILTMLIGLVFVGHTSGLGLRWYIAGYAPWTNAYESMVYAAWMIVLGGLVFARRFHVLPALAALLGGVLLFVAGLNQMNPEITPLVPVLQSYWLMLHVAVIMAGYGFFAICALTGLFNLSLMLFFNGRNRERMLQTVRELTWLNEMAMILGLVFMTTGTFLGAVWANESWGRYWGWDPKETWALISVVVYALVLHIRFIPGIKSGVYSFNLLSVLAIASVLMTYFGVNYYLSGLHSYGKNDAALMPWPFLLGGGIIAVIAVLAWIKYRKK